MTMFHLLMLTLPLVARPPLHTPNPHITSHNEADESASDAPPPPSYGYRGSEWAAGSLGIIAGHALTLGLVASPTSDVFNNCGAAPCSPNKPTLYVGLLTELVVAPLVAATFAWAVSADPHASLLSAWAKASVVHIPLMLLVLVPVLSADSPANAFSSPVGDAFLGLILVGDVVLTGLTTSFNLHPDVVPPPPSPVPLVSPPSDHDAPPHAAKELIIPLAFRF